MIINLRERIIGVVVLLLMAVLLITVILSGQSKKTVATTTAISIPPQPAKLEQDMGEQSDQVDGQTNLDAVNLDEAVSSQQQLHTTMQAKEEQEPQQIMLPSKPKALAPPAKVERVIKQPVVKPRAAKQTKQINGKWIIQAGSFHSNKNAKILKKKLEAKGFTAHIEAKQTGEGNVSRVIIGPLASRKQAEELLHQLHSTTKVKGVLLDNSIYSRG